MIKKNWKKIIASLILIIMLFPYTAAFAAITVEEAGNCIANYAKDFCLTYGWNSPNNQTIYDYGRGRFDPGDYFYLRTKSFRNSNQSREYTKRRIYR